MKKLTLLGSTGSIGLQTLDVLQAAGYEVFALAAHASVDKLLVQAEQYKPKYIAVTDKAAADKLAGHLAGQPDAPVVLPGEEGLLHLAAMGEADVVLNAVSGIAGLGATLAAAGSGSAIALANKESMVTGGQLVVDAVRGKGVSLRPVDSEHSAIFQCLQDRPSAPALTKILLTASGGPFFGFTIDRLAGVTAADALRHPTWNMGAKITIDSASLMNKGMELIEAVWLFDVAPEQVEIVVHPQSIIHSMVEFSDGAILAQLGAADMRVPIQYALTYPARTAGPARRLSFDEVSTLTFARPDEETFRCLAACKKAMAKGGLYPCAANGASEAAVALFLRGEIGFLDMGRLVEGAVDTLSCKGSYSLADVYACDAEARAYVQAHK